MTEPAQSAESRGSVRPPDESELPPHDLGSTAQFQAFARRSEDDPYIPDHRDASVERAEAHADEEFTAAPATSESTGTLESGIVPASPDSKRGLYLALAVVVLVVVVVALLLILM